MKILAIESSAVTASVAIMNEDTLTAEYTVNYKRTHSQTLLPMIDEICSMTETDKNSFDLIAVSIGPGSHTGLRIGAATGKGIALVLDRPMAAVPTLKALAYNVYGDDRLICAVMDARRRHVYAQIFRFKDGAIEEVTERLLVSYEELTEKLNKMGEDVLFVGDGITPAMENFEGELTCPHAYASPAFRTQRASSVALLARDMYNRGETVSTDELKPDYLRPSQAERERENHGN